MNTATTYLSPHLVLESCEGTRFPADATGARSHHSSFAGVEPISFVHTPEIGSEQDRGDPYTHSALSDNFTYHELLTDGPLDIETITRTLEPELDMIHLDFFNPNLEITYLDFASPIVGSSWDLNCT